MNNLIDFLKVIHIFSQLQNKSTEPYILLPTHRIRMEGEYRTDISVFDINFSSNQRYILDTGTNPFGRNSAYYEFKIAEKETDHNSYSWVRFDEEYIHLLIEDLKEMDEVMFNLTHRGCELEIKLKQCPDDFTTLCNELLEYDFPEEWNIIK